MNEYTPQATEPGQPIDLNKLESIVSASAAARRCGVTLETFHNWRKRGHVLARQLPNGRYIVAISEVQRLVGQPGPGSSMADNISDGLNLRGGKS